MIAATDRAWLMDQLDRRRFRRLCTGVASNFFDRPPPSTVPPGDAMRPADAWARPNAPGDQT